MLPQDRHALPGVLLQAVIAGLTLYMNYTFLPEKLKPSAVSLGMVLLASAVSRSLALKAEYAL